MSLSISSPWLASLPLAVTVLHTSSRAHICDVEETQGPTCARQVLSLSYETPEPESRLNLLCTPLRWPHVVQFSFLDLLNSSDCCPLSPDHAGTHLRGDSDLYPKTLSKGPCLFLILKKLIIRGLTSCHSLMSYHFHSTPGTPFWGLLFLFSCYFYSCSYKQFYYKHPCLCSTNTLRKDC